MMLAYFLTWVVYGVWLYFMARGRFLNSSMALIALSTLFGFQYHSIMIDSVRTFGWTEEEVRQLEKPKVGHKLTDDEKQQIQSIKDYL